MITNWKNVATGLYKPYTYSAEVMWGMTVSLWQESSGRDKYSWFWVVRRKDGTKVDISPYTSYPFGIKLGSTYQGPYISMKDAFADINSWHDQFEEIEEPL